MKVPALKIDKSLFTGNHINSEGLYLWKNDLGVELINVYRVPASRKHGLSWESYLAYGSRKRNVCNLQGEFIKLQFN